MKRVALCVGVDHYSEPGFPALEFAEADAVELYAFLKHRLNFDRVERLRAPDPHAVRELARSLVRELEPGSLFLFFFSGHGYELNHEPLLLGPKASLSGLEYLQDTVPVALLKKETSKPGVNCVFILDACRKELTRSKGAGGGWRGVSRFKDIVTTRAEERAPAGAFTMLCGCDEGELAQEIPALKCGLFSGALLDIFAAAVERGSEIKLNDQLEADLRLRMNDLAQQHHLPVGQRPWIKRSGEIPVLFRQETPAPAAPRQPQPAVPRAVQAPLAGPVVSPARPSGNQNQSATLNLPETPAVQAAESPKPKPPSGKVHEDGAPSPFLTGLVAAGVFLLLGLAAFWVLKRPAPGSDFGFYPVSLAGDAVTNIGGVRGPDGNTGEGRWSYESGSEGWACVSWVYPRDYGTNEVRGMDLRARNQSRLVFSASGAKGGERLQFFAGDPECRVSTNVTLSRGWTEYRLHLKEEALTNLHVAFGWQAESRATFNLRELKFE